MAPKEDPEAKRSRLRERKLASQERTDSTEELAAGMTSDIGRLYGPRFSMFGMR